MGSALADAAANAAVRVGREVLLAAVDEGVVAVSPSSFAREHHAVPVGTNRHGDEVLGQARLVARATIGDVVVQVRFAAPGRVGIAVGIPAYTRGECAATVSAARGDGVLEVARRTRRATAAERRIIGRNADRPALVRAQLLRCGAYGVVQSLLVHEQ
jgi:hypothetical protein